MGQMSLLGASVAVLLLINIIGANVIPLQNFRINSERYSESSEARDARVEYRLTQTVTPETYNITLTLKPDFGETGNFTGEVTILVTAKTNGNNITLHYDNITIHDRKVTDIDGNPLLLDDDGENSYNKTTNIYTLILSDSQKLTPDKKYKIYLNYTGHLRDDMAGFYRSSYTAADGSKRWLATTQFEPTDARRAFPCFDEPALKAKFQINITRPEGMKSISNAALNNTESSTKDGLETDIFNATPSMSTYLVAFIVSDFANLTSEKDERIYNIWARNDSIQQAQYGLSVTPGIIQFMDDFTKIPFEFQKLDQAAIPDFSAGAMENWALVTYRERLMLFDVNTSTTSNKQSIATVIAHELSHQWFGDLVTPEWWDYLWLNEGFATYFEYFATHMVENGWRLDEQFVPNVHQNALAADASNTTHSITTSVYSPAQINSIFDSISYDKAGSVIRQAKHFLTPDVFMKGLGEYLNNRSHNSSNPDNLFAALQDAEKAANIFNDPDLNVKSIMDSWTKQPGYPLITASRMSDGSIHITQKRFLRTGESDPNSNTTWWVPVSYTKGKSIDFSTTVPKVWLKNETESHVKENLAADEWFILNIQETAFYRVLYNEDNYKLLTDYLKSDDHTKIHPLNKAQLLDDSLNLARASVLNYATALDVTTYLEQETDFIPWLSYFNALTFLNSRLTGTEAYDNFQKYVLRLLGTMYEKVGFTPKEKDDHSTKLIRSTVLTWACNFNSELCLQNATISFKQWMTNNNSNLIPPDIRSVVYCSALRNGGEAEWKFLWDQYNRTNVSTEQVLILNALGCTKNTTLLNTYLGYSITPNSGIRQQDLRSVFTAVYSRAGGVDVAFDFLNKNFEDIKKYYTAMNDISKIVTGIASQMTTQEQRDELEKFLDKNKATLGSTVQSALENVDANLQWLDKFGAAISAWLADYTTDAASYLSFSPTISIIIILSGYLITNY